MKHSDVVYKYLNDIETKLWKISIKYFTDSQLDYLDDKTIYVDHNMLNPLVRFYDNKRN